MIMQYKRLWKLFLCTLIVCTIGVAGAMAQQSVDEVESDGAILETEPAEEQPVKGEADAESPEEGESEEQEEQSTQAEPTPEVEESEDSAEDKTSVDIGGGGIFDELHIRDADVNRALEMLNVQARRNIITTKEVTGKVTADLYNVTFHEALDAILRANGFEYMEQGNFIYVMTAEQKKELEESQREMTVQMFRLHFVTATDAQTLITPMLSDKGSVAITPQAQAGIATSDTDTGGVGYATGDILVVSDYEENLRRIGEVLREIDEKPQQVLIEATLLRARLNEDNALGIDFNALAGVDFRGLDSTTNGLTDVNPGEVDAELDNTAGTFRTDFASGVPGGGFSFGLVSSNLGFFVRALESITDVTVMANPKLLVVNKQRGEVMVGNRDGYLTTTFTETTASQTVEFLETGTRLVVRPYIARDDYVRMEIHPEDSSGSVATVGQNALPTETTTEVTSNVMVRDGRTIVIGGLFREETSAGRSQVPVLGNVPYVGTLWRSTDDSIAREEVIILITPRIVDQDVDETVSEQLRDEAERFRIGQRKGLQWFGRSRLAHSYMQRARKHAAKGNREKALWNVDMALSLLPRMNEAIRLKERLTGREYWADSARESAAKYMVQDMMMRDLGRPVDPVTYPDKPRDGSELPKEVREKFGIGKKLEVPLSETAPTVEQAETLKDAEESDAMDEGSEHEAMEPAEELVEEGAPEEPGAQNSKQEDSETDE